MKEEPLFDELCQLAERLDLDVVMDKGDFHGGYCRVLEDRRIVINKHNLLPTQLRVLARNLLQFDLSNMYLLPAVREFLEEVSAEEETGMMSQKGIVIVEKD